jgi:hypothetical protein
MLDKRAAAMASVKLSAYSLEKGIYMKINYFNADHTHALIDFYLLISPSNESSSCSKVVRLTGLMKIASLEVDSHGDEAMAPFQSRIQTSIAYADTLRIRLSTIAKEPLKMNTNFS